MWLGVASFLVGWSACLSLIFYKFLVGASKVVTPLAMGQCMPPHSPTYIHACTHTPLSGVHKQTTMWCIAYIMWSDNCTNLFRNMYKIQNREKNLNWSCFFMVQDCWLSHHSRPAVLTPQHIMEEHSPLIFLFSALLRVHGKYLKLKGFYSHPSKERTYLLMLQYWLPTRCTTH